MAKKFDPYYKWLGIPPRDQPPNNYRLLGIELFESDRDVIDAAANRVMAYLKDLAAGDEAEYSQQLLNEVSRARISLLNKHKKETYDKELRADLKSKGVPEPKAGKPAARAPAKKRAGVSTGKEAAEEPPVTSLFPKIRIDAPRPKPDAPEVYAEPDEPAEEGPAEEGPAEEKSRRKLIAVIVAAVGGVLLAGLIVTVVLLLSGSGDDQVASAQNGGTQDDGNGSATTNGEGSGTEGKPESKPGMGVESDPETDPEADPESDPETKPEPAEPDAKTEPKPNDPPADVESKLPDWAPEPKDPDDGSQKPDDEPPPDVPGNPKGKGSPPDDTAVTKVDVPDVTPEEKPDPPKPAQQPFAGLPSKITLPDLEVADAMDAQVIGPIHVAPGELCFIKLRGGEHASKGAQAFGMRNADGGLAERDWEIFSRDGEDDPETKIAHLSIDDQSQLTFQWQSEAKALPLAAQLCNCAFRFSSTGESHDLTLRQPEQVEAMTLDLKKTTTDRNCTIEMAPDPTGIKIEIVGVQESKYKVMPAPTIEAKQGEAWIELEDGGGLLSLKVETDMKRRLEVAVTPHVKLAAGAPPQKCNAKQFGELFALAQRNLFDAERAIKQLPQAIGQAQGPLKAGLQDQLARFEQAHPALVAAVAEGQKLATFLQTVDGNMQIQFRVFYDADSTEVDLLHIGGPADGPDDQAQE
ncbi:MAG: hypothetical protein H8E44_17965 [Planctomycetes bacterium]|nr:hypothetical protein [Planctomycetota bacterium]MBL7040462.1 hypothetical protein [Pirellulaceae bacterium]